MSEENTKFIPWFKQFLGSQVTAVIFNPGLKKTEKVEGKLIFWDKVSKAMVIETPYKLIYVRKYVMAWVDKA